MEVDIGATESLSAEWAAWDIGVELTVVPSPYRSVLRPLVRYVNALLAEGHADLVTVVVPEIVPHRWWEHLLHHQTALFIRTAFLFKANVVVTAVPYLLGRAARPSELAHYDGQLDANSGDPPATVAMSPGSRASAAFSVTPRTHECADVASWSVASRALCSLHGVDTAAPLDAVVSGC